MNQINSADVRAAIIVRNFIIAFFAIALLLTTNPLNAQTGECSYGLWNTIALAENRDANTMTIAEFRTLAEKYGAEYNIPYNRSANDNARLAYAICMDFEYDNNTSIDSNTIEIAEEVIETNDTTIKFDTTSYTEIGNGYIVINDGTFCNPFPQIDSFLASADTTSADTTTDELVDFDINTPFTVPFIFAFDSVSINYNAEFVCDCGQFENEFELRRYWEEILLRKKTAKSKKPLRQCELEIRRILLAMNGTVAPTTNTRRSPNAESEDVPMKAVASSVVYKPTTNKSKTKHRRVKMNKTRGRSVGKGLIGKLLDIVAPNRNC